MNIHLTLRSVGQLQRTVTLVAIFMITGSVACITTAQVYEPGSTVLGKTIGDWSKDYRDLRLANDPTQMSTKTQPGPVFFFDGIRGGNVEVDVPAGAPIFSALGTIVAWDHGLSGNQSVSRTGARNEVRPLAFQLDDLSMPRAELTQYWEEVSTPFLHNGDPNGWQAGYMLMMDPLAPGEHQLHQQVNALGALSTLNAKINVFELATESLAVGQPYTQDFDTLGTDGSAEIALPNAWTVTDENAFNIYQHETAASFPITTTARGAYPFAMSAGVPGETDRALSIYALRDSEVRRHHSSTSQLQFLADADGAADSLQVQFDIEAWDASTSSSASDPGEAAFDVTIDIDSGNGFEPLLDLGRITTGQLQRPDGDYLNGNDATNRVSFDSGHASRVDP